MGAINNINAALNARNARESKKIRKLLEAEVANQTNHDARLDWCVNVIQRLEHRVNVLEAALNNQKDVA